MHPHSQRRVAARVRSAETRADAICDCRELAGRGGAIFAEEPEFSRLKQVKSNWVMFEICGGTVRIDNKNRTLCRS